MPDVFGVTADVFEDPPISISDGATVEFTIRLGRYGPVENAYWHVSIIPTGSTVQPPGKLEVTRQWFEIDGFRRNTLHYVVNNFSPGALGSRCEFVRKLVRIPAR